MFKRPHQILLHRRASQDYDTYTNVMYLHVAVVGVLLLGLLVLVLTVHKVQKSKALRSWVKVLHVSDEQLAHVQLMQYYCSCLGMQPCLFVRHFWRCLWCYTLLNPRPARRQGYPVSLPVAAMYRFLGVGMCALQQNSGTCHPPGQRPCV